ncbi:UNVERIFIED_CONTAM: hypothetical protein GTU68_040104 [Idotea baltica]|nr:hypothetical protein [Idotea baltica]
MPRNRRSSDSMHCSIVAKKPQASPWPMVRPCGCTRTWAWCRRSSMQARLTRSSAASPSGTTATRPPALTPSAMCSPTSSRPCTVRSALHTTATWSMPIIYAKAC